MPDEVGFTFEVVKVTGAPDAEFWSGVFTEKPQDSEKLALGGQLFLALTIKAGEESANLAHLFWTDLTTAFYNNLSGGVLHALQEAAAAAFEKLPKTFDFTNSGVVVASVWGKILYLLSFGTVAVVLVRAGKSSKILQAGSIRQPTSASGFLKDQDLVFLATEAFFAEFANFEKFQKLDPSQIQEELASQIAQSQHGSKISACILKIKEASLSEQVEVVTFAEAGEVVKQPRISVSQAKQVELLPKVILNFWVNFVLLVFRPIPYVFKFLLKRDIYLKLRHSKFSKVRPVGLILAILILILVASLAVGIWQRQRKMDLTKFEEYYNSAQTLYEEAAEISSINKLRARELLGQAQKNLDEAKKLKFEKGKVAALKEKIDAANRESLKLVKVENPQLVFDLSLVKTQPALAEIEKPENLLAFDKASPTLFFVDLEAKTGQIAGGGKEFAGFANFTSQGNFAYFVKPQDGIFQLDLNTRELKKVIAASNNWGEILDLTSFAGNLYLLDGKIGQIWKYTGGAGGFSEISGFLKQAGANFSSGSLTVDGFIWVLSGDGKLYQVIPQDTKTIEISGLDKPLSSKTILRTNPEAENLYIADLGNARILVISKAGLYLAQYTSGFFGQISDLAVDEKLGKLYFSAGSKVYSIDLVK